MNRNGHRPFKRVQFAGFFDAIGTQMTEGPRRKARLWRHDPCVGPPGRMTSAASGGLKNGCCFLRPGRRSAACATPPGACATLRRDIAARVILCLNL